MDILISLFKSILISLPLWVLYIAFKIKLLDDIIPFYYTSLNKIDYNINDDSFGLFNYLLKIQIIFLNLNQFSLLLSYYLSLK